MLTPSCTRIRRFAAGVVPLLALLSIAGSGQPAEAASVGYSVVDVGSNWLRYEFTMSGFDLVQNQEIDIRFDPLVYGALRNGVSGSGFDLLLLQPNNPPGASGSYGILALLDHPSFSGVFSVDALLYARMGAPAPLPYVINKYGGDGLLLSSQGGAAADPLIDSVPEPASWTITLLGACCGAALIALRRQSSH